MERHTMDAAMAGAASVLVTALTGAQRPLAHLDFPADPQRRTLEYRPRTRPGVSLTELAPAARKAAHRLLATGLSRYAFAQAVTITGLEEVLDRDEGGHRGRHGDDYWVAVFGQPGADRWAWRFEGHHVSVNVTVHDGEVYATPVFLGANPATVSYASRPVVRPLAPEEDLARALLDAMGTRLRAAAVVSDTAPADIRSGPNPRAGAIEPPGVPAARLDPVSRTLLDQLVTLYVARLPDPLAARELDRLDRRELTFAWEGPTHPGVRHYYRVQGPDLLIEYDNTSADGNHVHSVFRRPRSDFGGDPLADHRATHPHPPAPSAPPAAEPSS